MGISTKYPPGTLMYYIDQYSDSKRRQYCRTVAPDYPGVTRLDGNTWVWGMFEQTYRTDNSVPAPGSQFLSYMREDMMILAENLDIDSPHPLCGEVRVNEKGEVDPNGKIAIAWFEGDGFDT